MAKKKCKPRIVQRVAPTTKIKCFNCGCTVDPGACHCGAVLGWAWDNCDGWYQTGSISLVKDADNG